MDGVAAQPERGGVVGHEERTTSVLQRRGVEPRAMGTTCSEPGPSQQGEVWGMRRTQPEELPHSLRGLGAVGTGGSVVHGA